MHFVPITLKNALVRIRKREHTTKRYTPEEMVVDRKFFLNNIINEYKKVVDVFKEAK